MSVEEQNGHLMGTGQTANGVCGQKAQNVGRTEMKKSVGLLSGTALIVGTMIGMFLFIKTHYSLTNSFCLICKFSSNFFKILSD